MITIGYINEKGGIGKTSICLNVAYELAKRNKKVIMIDLDGQRANLTFFAGIKKSDDMLTIYDVLMRNKDIKSCIHNVSDNLDIIPASVDVTGLTQTAKVSRFKQALKDITNDYDYCLVDVSPAPNWCHFLTLSASNYIIVPMLADVASLESDNGIVESIVEVKDSNNSQLKVLGIVFNKFDERTNLSKQVVSVTEKIAEKLNTKIFDTKIRNCVAMSECVANHQSINDYDSKSTVANDIINLTNEIERRIAENG